MSSHLTRPTALTLVQSHAISKGQLYFKHHPFTPSVVLEGVRYCVCATCFEEMCELAAQWQRDYDSMLEDLRRSSVAFLGFDVWEEWTRKTS